MFGKSVGWSDFKASTFREIINLMPNGNNWITVLLEFRHMQMHSLKSTGVFREMETRKCGPIEIEINFQVAPACELSDDRGCISFTIFAFSDWGI